MTQPVLGFNGSLESFETISSEHFVVYFQEDSDQALAQRISQLAENLYTSVAYQIGYSRYSNFWTWEERVKIIVYPNQSAYLKATGKPAWSKGFARRHSEFLKSRVVVTYRQEKDFLDGLLPHEISHLILWDAIGLDKRIPIWFQEGVAQLQESSKPIEADRLMKFLISQNQYVRFGYLMNWDIRFEEDSKKVTVFYAQAVSIVDFMIKEYGSDAFGKFCRNIKQGQSIDGALRGAYGATISSVSELEEKWVRYMKR